MFCHPSPTIECISITNTYSTEMLYSIILYNIFDLMKNLYIYIACIYIYSILLTGMDGAAGGQILSARLFITQ